MLIAAVEQEKRRKCSNTSSSITLDLNGNFQQLELTILYDAKNTPPPQKSIAM